MVTEVGARQRICRRAYSSSFEASPFLTSSRRLRFMINRAPLREPPGEKRSGTIQSITIAARFLTILANAEEALALGVLARCAGTSSSTAHRYLHSLMKEGLATQDDATGRYDLGPTALSVGIAALKRIDPIEIAARHMKDLASRIAASGGVAIWSERGPTLVRWYRSAHFSISSLGLGDILPLDNTACGRVFQAFLPEGRIEMARRLQPDHFRGVPPLAGGPGRDSHVLLRGTDEPPAARDHGPGGSRLRRPAGNRLRDDARNQSRAGIARRRRAGPVCGGQDGGSRNGRDRRFRLTRPDLSDRRPRRLRPGLCANRRRTDDGRE
ncbi:IclR family transcriptional regulator [Consotaella aegiceratis]|uniref:IclR family transcriptional regulator n=1 Tax=Consotaella aegiceratis TaxID=3097961 RepID=UPI003D8022F6